MYYTNAYVINTVRDSNVEQDLKAQNWLTEAIVVSMLNVPCMEEAMQLTEPASTASDGVRRHGV